MILKICAGIIAALFVGAMLTDMPVAGKLFVLWCSVCAEMVLIGAMRGQKVNTLFDRGDR